MVVLVFVVFFCSGCDCAWLLLLLLLLLVLLLLVLLLLLLSLFQHSPLQLLPTATFLRRPDDSAPNAKTAALPVGGGPPSLDGMRRALEVSSKNC